MGRVLRPATRQPALRQSAGLMRTREPASVLRSIQPKVPNPRRCCVEGAIILNAARVWRRVRDRLRSACHWRADLQRALDTLRIVGPAFAVTGPPVPAACKAASRVHALRRRSARARVCGRHGVQPGEQRLKYSMVPPTSGSWPPPARLDFRRSGVASRTNSRPRCRPAAGRRMLIKWCGTAARLAATGLAVLMSMPRVHQGPNRR